MLAIYKQQLCCCHALSFNYETPKNAEYTVGLRVPTKQIRKFTTFTVSNVARLYPSDKCSGAANSKCRDSNFLSFFFEDTVAVLILFGLCLLSSCYFNCLFTVLYTFSSARLSYVLFS
jgi:hypothetical protein